MKKISLFLISVALLTLTGFSQPLSGTKTIPGDYATIALAIADLNAQGVTAPGVTFDVSPGYTETFANATDGIITATGTTTNDAIVFQRNGIGVNPVITAGVGTSTTDAIIKIAGGNYITFNGINLQENPANITGTTQMEYGYFISNASAINGAQNNIIKNCTIILNRANTTSKAIYQYVFTTPTNATGANSNNKYQFITVENSYNGIQLTGNATYPDLSSEVSNCIVGANSPNDIGNGSSTLSALRLTSSQDALVFNNTVRNTTVTGAVNLYGIFLENVKGNSQVYNNKVYNITSTSTSTSSVLYGIRLDVPSTFQGVAYNNIIYGFSHGINTPSATIVCRPLAINVTGTGTVGISYNTVNVNLNANASVTAAYIIGGTVAITNNIFAVYSASGATSKRYCILRLTATITSNYNDFYIAAGTNNFVGYYTTDQTTLTDWQTASTQDANSVNVNPLFLGADDLHPSNPALNNLGTPVPVLVDIDGTTRDAATPDMGAYEFVPASCPQPSLLTASAITNNSASLTWTSNGSETQWNIEVGLSGFVPTGTPTNSGVTNPFTVIGLLGNTSYSYYVQADCGGSTSIWIGPFNFTTLCNNVNTFPFSESFDGTTFAPSCWTNVKTAGTGTPGVWDRQTTGTDPICTPHTGAAMARYYCFNYLAGTTGILVTPGLDLPSDLYQVRFWMYRDDGWTLNTDSINVYYNTSPNTTGAILLGTIYRPYTSTPVEVTPNQWYEYAFNMPAGSTGNGRYVIFEAVSDYGNNIFVDDVQIQLQPTCLAPSLLTATSITTNSAILGWTAGGGETAWDIQYGTFGFSLGTGTILNNVSTNPYTLTGLTSATNYQFYVLSQCSPTDSSTWTGPFSFTTICNNVNTFPYVESFDGITFAPICWSNTGTPPWDRQTTGTYPICTPHTGVAMARYNSYNYDVPATGILVTPGLDLPSDLYEVRFWMYRDNGYLTTADLVNIYYNTTPNTTAATLLGTINRSYTLAPVEATANQWYEYHFNMPAGSIGNGRYVIFEAVSDYGNNIFVDDVQIQLQPTCLAPSLLTATSITTNSAILGWTAGGTEALWNIELGTTGFTPTGTPTASGVLNPYSATSLTSSTTYDFYVQADCGGSTSSWAGPFSFTTLCNNVNTFPYVESFDGVAYAPLCWSNPSASAWDRQTAGTNPTCTPHSGAAMSRYYCFNYLAGTTGILVTPGLDLPSDLYEVHFWMYRDNGYATNTDLVNIYYNTTPNTTAATLLGTINRSNTLSPVEATANQWYEYHFNMPAGSTGNGRYVIFEAVSDYGNNIFVDDVQIQLQPTCLAPSLLTATSITTNSAILGWTAGGTEALWNIELGTTGFTPTGTPTASGVLNPYSATSLTSSTTYDFYVQADCGFGGTSTWTGPFSFSTLCDPLGIPYAENFDGVTPPALPLCMSKTNDNGDGIVWETYTGYANSVPNSMSIGYNSLLAMDDWFYTPGLNLQTGKTYKVSLAYSAENAFYPEKLEVKWGTAPNAAAMTSSQVFNNSNIVNTTYNNDSGLFTVPSNGIYYVGFHGYSDLDEYYLDVDDIAVTEVSTDAEILTFDIPSQVSSTVNSGAATVDIVMPFGTNVTALVPAITISAGATIAPLSGVAQDFTTPVTYLVTAEDGITTKSWIATVTLAVDWCNLQWPPSGTIVTGTAYNVYAQVYEPGVTEAVGQGAGITAWIGYNNADTDPSTWTNWVPATYNIDAGNNDEYMAEIASALPVGIYYYASRFQISGGEYQYGGFNAGGGGFWNGTTNVSGVLTVNPNTDTEILTFDISSQVSSTVNSGASTVDILMPCGTNVTALTPTITISAGATISPLSGVAQDFTNPVIYTVTAEDGITTSTWTVSVTSNPLPTVDLGADVVQCGGSVTLDAANAGSTYLWSDATTAQTLIVAATGTYAVTVTDVNGCTGTDAIDVTINALPIVDLGADFTQCGGDTLDAGNSGSTYLWSDNSTSQTLIVSTSGTYSVTVTNSCGTGTDAIDIVINPSPTVNLGADVTQCGSDTLDAGNTGSTYLWSDATTAQTLIVTSTGIYSVTVTNASLCSAVDTINVTINALPTITLTSPSAVTICQGDTTNIDLAFTGTSPWSWVGDDGSGPVTFTATSSPQTSPVAPSVTTTYSVISVTDANGCSNTSTDAVVVTVNPSPTVNLGSDIAQCGGTVTLDAANAGSTYLWSDASTNQTIIVAATGTFSVTVTNVNGCTGTDTIDVIIYTVSPVTITENAGVLTSDAASGNQWYEQTLGIIAGETNQTYTPTVTGNYYVIVTDANGCIDTSNVISFLISVNSNASGSSIIVYPNPANAQVWIDVVNKNASQTRIEIRTLDGRLLFENGANSLGNTRISVDLKEFASGVYVIKAISNENTSIQKLIVE